MFIAYNHSVWYATWLVLKTLIFDPLHPKSPTAGPTPRGRAKNLISLCTSLPINLTHIVRRCYGNTYARTYGGDHYIIPDFLSRKGVFHRHEGLVCNYFMLMYIVNKAGKCSCRCILLYNSLFLFSRSKLRRNLNFALDPVKGEMTRL